MKSIAVITLLISMFCVMSLGQTDPPQLLPGVKGSFETMDARVLKVYAAKDGEHRFVAYLVKWKDSEVVVSDPLARSDHKVGDTIKFLAQKIHIEKADPEVFALNFVLVEVLAPKPSGAQAPKPAD